MWEIIHGCTFPRVFFCDSKHRGVVVGNPGFRVFVADMKDLSCRILIHGWENEYIFPHAVHIPHCMSKYVLISSPMNQNSLWQVLHIGHNHPDPCHIFLLCQTPTPRITLKEYRESASRNLSWNMRPPSWYVVDSPRWHHREAESERMCFSAFS